MGTAGSSSQDETGYPAYLRAPHLRRDAAAKRMYTGVQGAIRYATASLYPFVHRIVR